MFYYLNTGISSVRKFRSCDSNKCFSSLLFKVQFHISKIGMYHVTKGDMYVFYVYFSSQNVEYESSNQ